MRRLRTWALALAFLPASAAAALAAPADAVQVGAIWLDRGEVSIRVFADYAARASIVTAAKREGGGFEYAAGWTRRPGWSFRRPTGAEAAPDEPAVHLTWAEASAYCAERGGRLPTGREWRAAGFTETRADPPGGLAAGRTYPFASGETPAGLWTSEVSGGRHRRVGSGSPGINGLHDMGGNVWEWLADRRGGEALTAGGSWWYGAAESRADRTQWKGAGFHALYIGFRCAYDR